ncbi:MAG: S26 family signal peptidase [Phycisphaerae bacterium]
MVSQRPESPPALSPQRSGELKRLRDAIESIVVAFILAFVFRAFVIEAFVIPTGSMAATLYGDHTTQTCPNCGYEYVSGWDARRRRPRRIVCPNCHTELLGVRPRRIERGDRILVFKFPFDLGGLGLGPRRWDVVVFKNPGDGRTNFIKRLIGMPNEVIEIIDGDIYVAPAETLSPAILEKLQQPPWDRQPLSPQQRSQLDRQLRIARKPASVQRSLWFVVYDQDYPPTKKYPGSGYPDWSSTRPGQSGWRRSPRELIFDGLERPFEDISFTGKDLRDFYAYNGQTGQPGKLVADLRSLRMVPATSRCSSATASMSSA